MVKPKRMNSGGFVGKKEPDEERPLNERLAERDNSGGGGSDGSGINVMAVGGRTGSSGVAGFAKLSGSVRVGSGVSVEPWVAASGSTKYGGKLQGGGVNVNKEFSKGGLIDPWNYKK